MVQILRQSNERVIVKVLQKEEEKEGEEKYEENKVEGTYLRNGLVDSAQIWN